jgi:Big-like domain-containing protein
VIVSDGTQTCNASVAVGSCSIAFTSAVGRTMTAAYAGDGNFAASTSLGVGQTVNPGSTTTTIQSQSPNPSVAGQAIAVGFTVTSTGGTPTGNVTVSDGAVSCVAAVSIGTCNLTPTVAGVKTLVATYAGDANFAGSTSTGVSQTVNAAPAASIAVSAGDGQTATVATSVAIAPAVIVRDQFGNPVAGVSVTFAVASGGGTVAPTTAVTTGADGIAGVTSWTLGTIAGANTLTATSGVLSGSPVTFTATGTAGPATHLAFTVQPTDTRANFPITPAVVVTARDQFENTATTFANSVTVGITPLSGTAGAVLSGTLTITPVSGAATFSNLSINLVNVVLTPYSLTAQAAGVTNATSATFNITP